MSGGLHIFALFLKTIDLLTKQLPHGEGRDAVVRNILCHIRGFLDTSRIKGILTSIPTQCNNKSTLILFIVDLNPTVSKTMRYFSRGIGSGIVIKNEFKLSKHNTKTVDERIFKE